MILDHLRDFYKVAMKLKASTVMIDAEIFDKINKDAEIIINNDYEWRERMIQMYGTEVFLYAGITFLREKNQ
jgi:spore coat polysaccharide biosynthesis predicted glycosyltransferase SpsG